VFYLFISLYITDIHTPISILRHTKIRFFIQLSKCERLFSMRSPNQHHEYFYPQTTFRPIVQTRHKRRATARLYGRIILFRKNQHHEYFYPQTTFPRSYRRAAARLQKNIYPPKNNLSHIRYTDNIYGISS